MDTLKWRKWSKSGTAWFYNAVLRQKDAHGMTNSGSPDQTAKGSDCSLAVWHSLQYWKCKYRPNYFNYWDRQVWKNSASNDKIQNFTTRFNSLIIMFWSTTHLHKITCRHNRMHDDYKYDSNPTPQNMWLTCLHWVQRKNRSAHVSHSLYTSYTAYIYKAHTMAHSVTSGSTVTLYSETHNI